MNTQRKVVITTTYNEMGIIIDTKAEEVAQPNLQPTCNQLATDTISRQQAIEAIHEDADWLASQGSDWQVERMERDKSILMSLPSAQSERQRGHWVEIGDEPYDEWECDVCGFVIDGSGCIDPEEYRDIYRFCPNCGADMRGEE